MVVVCRSCDTESPENFKFCPTCAAPLEPRPRPQVEERKIVSVLFVDLDGFTARSHDADPEDVLAALRPYHQVLKTEIERFGGTVEKFIGDAVMAVFGAPVAHEDDAERAVRAALRITEAIAELNHSTPELDLSIRAAVNTGEALVILGARPQAGEGMVTGDVVNTAARMQTVAPINGVAVGEVTYRSTKDVIAYERLEPVSVKGKPQLLEVWRAVAARSRFGIDLDRAPSTPFIGRAFELDLLRNTFRRALRESSVQLVTVVGEPGIGKSRLVSEFFGFIDKQEEIVFFRQGRSLPYGEGITFWALGEIVKAHAGILESDSPAVAEDKLRIAVEVVNSDLSERDWLFARLAPLVGATTHGGGVEQEESFAAWRRFLEAVANRSPLVVVFEDLHWADEAMLEFVEHVVEWSTRVPLFVLCTARPELFDKHPGWGAGQRNSATVSLGPLDDSETAQLISGLLARAVLPAEVHAGLLERAGGNPLYAEEFIRMLWDRGIVNEQGPALMIDPTADIPLPDTVQSLIAARLDTLTPDKKALLHDAAVAGKVFWAGAVAALGGVDTPTVTLGLHQMERKELVRRARVSSIAGDHEYVFWHASIRDVCYGQIPRGARADKHRAMARWLEGIAGDRARDHAEVLAHHYTHALQLTRSYGNLEEATELEDPASRFLVMAGDRALHLDAATAEVYYRRALELLPVGHPERAHVLLKAGESAHSLGQFTDSARHMEDAISEFRAQGDPLNEGRALVRLNFVAWSLGDTARAHQLLWEAIALLEEAPHGGELCYAYAEQAFLRLLAGVPSEAMEWADKALSLPTGIGNEENVILALMARGDARGHLGDGDGIADLEEALRRSIALGHSNLTARAYNDLASATEHSKGPAPALDLYKQGIEFAKQRGLTERVMYLQTNVAWNLYQLGNWDQSLQLTTEAVRWGEEHQAGQIEVYGLHTRACVLVHRGHLQEASAVEGRLLELAREIGDLQTLVPALVIGAIIRSAVSDPSAAVSLVQEMTEHTKDAPEWRARELPAAARTVISAGRPDLATILVPDESEVHTNVARHCVVTACAILHEAHRHWEEAARLYEQAAGRWNEFGIVLEEGQALLGRGRCLFSLGDYARAADSLHQARAIFTRLGAAPLLADADTRLQKVKAVSS